MKPLRTIELEDDKVSRFQDNVADWGGQLTRIKLLDGILIENITLVSGSANYIAHKLGRLPVLWFPVRKYQEADIWEERNTATNTLMTLQCSANVTVCLWVA